MSNKQKKVLFWVIVGLGLVLVGFSIYRINRLGEEKGNGINMIGEITNEERTQNEGEAGVLVNGEAEGSEGTEGGEDREEEGLDEKEITEEIDTSDWVTYENETYGFSLRYPSSWSLAGENTSLTSYSFQGISSFGINSPDFVVNNKGAQVGVGLLRLSSEYQDKDPLEYLSTIGCVKTLYEVRGYDYIVETDQNSHDIMRYWYTNVVLTEIVDGWKWTGMESVDGKLYKNPGDTFQAFRYITSCYEIHPDYINPNDLVKDRIALMINIDMTINDPSYYPIAMKIVDSFNYIKKD